MDGPIVQYRGLYGQQSRKQKFQLALESCDAGICNKVIIGNTLLNPEIRQQKLSPPE